MTSAHEMTALIQAAGRGEPAAQKAVFDLAYDELKRIARGTLRRSGGDYTINPTTLVHEAYMKLAHGFGSLNDSTHFYSLFARAMRQVLLDLVRSVGTVKHGSGQRRVELTERMSRLGQPLEELIEVDAALRRLEAIDPELGELVEWHFFAGLSFVEIAAARGVNERTVRRRWEMARALLLQTMG